MSKAIKWSAGILILALIFVALGFWLGKHSQRFNFSFFQKPAAQAPSPEQPSIPPSAPLPEPKPGLTDFEQKVIMAVKTSMPAVVNIYTERRVVVGGGPIFPFSNDPFFRRFFGDRFFSVPQEQVQRSLGSGVIVSQDGYILTNNHVIAGADLINVSLLDKRTFKAEVVGADPKTDLALLKISAKGLPILKMGDSNKLEVGQFVLAIGNPFGLSGTVTKGIVSAKGRANLQIAEYEDFIQTDAPINRGNSGGALVNLDGELVGINTVILSESGGSVGIGFAIPANMAKAVMESLIKYGKVVRGWLGVSIQDLSYQMKESFKFKGEGVLVSGVVDGGPAEKVGFKPGDIIAYYRGVNVKSAVELKKLVGETKPGEKVEIKVFREGKVLSLFPVIEELKDEKLANLRLARENNLGLEVEDLTNEIRQSLGLPESLKGVVVRSVQPESRADQAEIQPGDVILRVNQNLVQNTKEFWAVVASSGKSQILIWLWRDAHTIFTIIPAGE